MTKRALGVWVAIAALALSACGKSDKNKDQPAANDNGQPTENKEPPDKGTPDPPAKPQTPPDDLAVEYHNGPAQAQEGTHTEITVRAGKTGFQIQHREYEIGISGEDKNVKIKSRVLTADEAAQLYGVIVANNFFELKDSYEPDEQVFDGGGYDVEVVAGGKTKNVSVSNTQAKRPGAVVRALRKLAPKIEGSMEGALGN